MIVLASQSASRRAMLEAAGVPFEDVPAHVDERALESELVGAAPEAVAQALAVAKARAVAKGGETRWVLGSDSLVSVDGRRFDKPGSIEQAAEHLRFFSGKTMHLHSAAALVRGGELGWACSERAMLRVRPLSEAFIAGYLAAEWPAVAGCVGVFRIEALGIQLFDAIEGDHFTVLGMPLINVLRALRDLGELAA